MRNNLLVNGAASAELLPFYSNEATVDERALALDQEILFDPYRTNRYTGSFIVVDRLSNATVGAGMIAEDDAGWEAVPDEHLTRHLSAITPAEREARYGQRAVTVFLTGLTGAGKSTIATALERQQSSSSSASPFV